jgi:hypothetical protein
MKVSHGTFQPELVMEVGNGHLSQASNQIQLATNSSLEQTLAASFLSRLRLPMPLFVSARSLAAFSRFWST